MTLDSFERCSACLGGTRAQCDSIRQTALQELGHIGSATTDTDPYTQNKAGVIAHAVQKLGELGCGLRIAVAVGQFRDEQS